jgi:hypothetical protein
VEGESSQVPGPQPPSEEELRAQIEEQLKQVRVQDLLIESAASIVNLTVRRIAKEDERDLEQAQVGIEAVRALSDLIEGDVQAQIRSALSEVQILYAKAAKGEPLGGEEGEAPQPPPEEPPPAQQQPQQQPPPKLWTPGRD